MGRTSLIKAEIENTTCIVHLTKREQEILQKIAEGYSMENLAAIFEVSYHTINTHIKNIYTKMRVNSRTQAVWKAHQDGLIKFGG